MVSRDLKINQLFTNWLTIGLFLIFLMIIVGGLTRLTNSGLSITEWELFKGIFPPINQESWIMYFELYKSIPQFKVLNPQMTLDEFKIIFYWEYGHRLLGRLIGLFFLLPLLYFHIKKIDLKFLIPSYIILFLIILQGIIGWYMVESGLVNNVTVSHYRLSLHLSMAIIIISIIYWQILNSKSLNHKVFFNYSRKSFPFLFLIILIFLQIIFGAFVSGLDAGKVYQTWPLMGLNYFPDDISTEGFLNFFDLETLSLVQFYHRNLAYFIILYVLFLGFILKKNNFSFEKPFLITVSVLSLQVILGILALITDLHIFVASAHQITSVILILSALNLYYSIIK